MPPLNIVVALMIAVSTAAPPSLASDTPGLIVLSDTGRQQDGRPVVVRVEQPAHVAVLTRAYSGRIVRLYQLVQRFVHPERTPEPAYLLLSDNQGGFPRFGFVLDGKLHPDTAYVDLHRRSDLSGRAGAMDQIYPHELLHIIVKDLAGEAPEGHASQVHAIAVRTDRITAFNEGFAEHGQAMAIDDPDGVEATRAIASDVRAFAHASDQFENYRRAVSARWSVAPKARITFPLWFSQAEQIMRYHGVKANLFARDPDVPDRLYTNRTAYDAYLIQNVMPGRPDGTPKSAARMLATEGVVSALFYRLVNTPSVQNTTRDDGFYARFGVTCDDIDPLGNAYLKVFAAIHEGRYDASAVIDAYGRLFPDEREAVDAVRREALLGQDPPRAPEIWLLNERFTAGRSLFDQYRAMPRPHAFDLNASSRADLAGVAGVSPALASAILASAPFASVADLQRVPGMTAPVVAALQEMKRAMDAPPPPGTSAEGGLSFGNIIKPYAWRALFAWLGAALVGSLLYRRARRVAWWHAALNGIAVALVGLIAAWTVDSGNALIVLLIPVAVPLIVFGVPGALIRGWRSHSAREGAVVLGAWALAALPAALVVRPLG
ncbi:MAG: hypothetical protein A3G21_02220 [Acidobacteria bacterium RIFCSPLOWO2_12_FULL_66_21]|nr:MAG: hypothetical protein A3G21_02220 [Acidobacteria bacterium RIFCSPLOWO2_12_FULL_66_21]